MQKYCMIPAYLLAALPTRMARCEAHKNFSENSSDASLMKRRIFVDVSVFSKHDAGTGIQRVVREVLRNLLKNSSENYTVIPVAATRKDGYRTTSISLKNPSKNLQKENESTPVSLSKGDIFLGLDLAAHLLPHHYRQLLEWKRSGASIQVVVYDLLPALHPAWFNPRSGKNFKKWLRTLAIFADRFHCISETVKLDLLDWLESKYKILLAHSSASVFPLGSNLSDITLSTEKLFNQPPHDAVDFMQRFPSVLMVGTIEPRKGHAEVLKAFSDFWRSGGTHQLVIVGAPGWKTDVVQKQLIDASNEHNKIIWIRDSDDILLAQLYRASCGVIVASEGEGYGLPIIEAAFFGKPVLARDIPVFREIAKGSVTFFSNNLGMSLSSSTIFAWLESNKSNATSCENLVIPNWKNTAEVLLKNMGINNPKENV